MNKLIYIIGFFLFVTLHISALRISSSAELAQFDKIGESIGNKLFSKLDNGYNSFIETVTDKVYDKFGNHLSNPKVADRMLVLLENNAELLNIDHFKDHNLALIQSQFFRKLKERFMNSKLGQGLKRLGQKIGSKLKELYQKHGQKIKEMFKVLVKGFAIPMAVNFARKHMDKWKQTLLKVTKHMKHHTREMVNRVIEKMFIIFHKKMDMLAHKYPADKQIQEKAAKVLMGKENEVNKIEHAEEKLKEQAASA